MIKQNLQTFFRNRFCDVLVSVYLYNEYVGYTELEKLLVALKKKYPHEYEFIAAVEKHAQDEKKHYRLFAEYFSRSGTKPFLINKTYGYIDLFVRFIFRKQIASLDQEKIINDDTDFFRLCRLIMMTEERGLKQVRQVLRVGWIQKHPYLFKVFKIVERDEPSHFQPYQKWLLNKSQNKPGFKEWLVDFWIHHSIQWIKFPWLFFNFRLRRQDTLLTVGQSS